MSFTHLHVHTTWSRFDGLAKIEELFKKASELGQQGLAITDHGTMAGVPEFLSVAARYPQIKPVVGCEFYLAEESISKPSDRNFHLILLAKNLTGYHTLLRLCSIAGTDGLYRGKPCIDHNVLSADHEGLIALSACIGGEIPQAVLEGDMTRARKMVRWYKDLFGEDFFLEVSSHHSHKTYYKGNVPELQDKANKVIFRLGKEEDVKVVATNDVHMVNAEDYKAHEILMCCNTKTKMEPGNKYFYTGEEYLKSEMAMLSIFADHQEAVHNTAVVLEKIERFDISLSTQLPEFPLPEGFSNADEYLRSLAYEGLEARAAESHNSLWGQRGEKERLEQELKDITSKGFANYFLILWDIAKSVREKGHTVGPGRDFAPASFLFYVLGVTDVDSMEVSLPFEKFLPAERISLPDVNIDFDTDGRQLAYDHLREKYGKDHVALMASYGRRYKKAAIHPLIERTIISEDIYPCAVLLSREPMNRYVPVRKIWNWETGRDELMGEYDAYHAEKTGILKLDFLSHIDLDIIRGASRGITMPDTFDDPSAGDIHELATSNSMNPPGEKDYGHGAIAYRKAWLKIHFPKQFSQALSILTAVE